MEQEVLSRNEPKLLLSGPCGQAGRALEQNLRENSQLLPQTMNHAGVLEPVSLERLAKEYPTVDGSYLSTLVGHLLKHLKSSGDKQNRRFRTLRHGDESLLTLLSAFQPQQDAPREKSYLSLSKNELHALSLHESLLARETGAPVLQTNRMPTFLGRFYKEMVTFSGHRAHVFCLAFDRTNRRLFTGSDDFLVKVWDTKTGHLIYTIRGHQNVITDIAINEENTLVATASSDGFVRVWTMDGFVPVVALKAHQANVRPFTTVKFSPSPKADTRYLMATNEDGLVRLWKWDVNTLQFFDKDTPITWRCKFKGTDRLRCSSFNYTGTRFAVAGDDGFVYVFSTVKNSADEALEASLTSSLESRPSGRGRSRIADALFPKPNQRNDLDGLAVFPIAHLEGHLGSITDLAYSHDGKRILSGSQDGTARIWSLDETTGAWSSIELDITLNQTDVPAVKPRLANESRSPYSRLSMELDISIDTSNEKGRLVSPPPSFHRATNANGNLCMTKQSACTLSSRAETPTAAGPTQAEEDIPFDLQPKVSMILWNADNRLCIIATTAGDIKVYHAYSGKQVCVLKGHHGEIYAVESHPSDPATILSAGYDGNVILWDIKRRQVISCKNYPGRVFLDCKFSRDGTQYALTDDDGGCTLFNIAGLRKDYEQANGWRRGQFFYTDYNPLRHAADGSFIDEQTLQPPHLLPYSPIIDMTGVEYANQDRTGYGRDLPLFCKTQETESARRLESYEMEEERIRTGPRIEPEPLDRAQVTKRRRDFVKNDDEEEVEVPTNEPPMMLPPPIQPPLLPDDSADEDYLEETNGGGSSEESGSEAGVSDAELHDNDDWIEDDEDGPVTRSRAGRTRHPSSHGSQRGRRGGRRGRGRGRGRPPNSAAAATAPIPLLRAPATRTTRTTRNTRRRAEPSEDEDEDDMPVRPRRRQRQARISYMESDSSEDELIQVDSESADEMNGDASASDRKGKRRLRVSPSDEEDEEDDDFVQAESSHAAKRRGVGRSKPEPMKKKGPGRTRRLQARALHQDEIPLYAPREWIRGTRRTLSKYHPQVHDRVAIMTEGHQQYWEASDLRDYCEQDHGPIPTDEPVLFGTVTGVTWQVGPPTFCQLKLEIRDLLNGDAALVNGETPVWSDEVRNVVIDYGDQDGTPEFLVLWDRFLASMRIFRSLRIHQRVDAMYDDEKYTGTIASIKRRGMSWRRVQLPNPWTCYHVQWDDKESEPEDLSPWEVVPSGRNFYEEFDVAPRLPESVARRASDVLAWLISMDDFQIFVHDVDFYLYPEYLSQIAYPICLTMIKERVENGFYRSERALLDDVDLVRHNAQKFNQVSSSVWKDAGRLVNFFKSRLQSTDAPLSLAARGRRATRGRRQAVETSDDDEYEQVEEEEEEEEPPSIREDEDESASAWEQDDDSE